MVKTTHTSQLSVLVHARPQESVFVALNGIQKTQMLEALYNIHLASLQLTILNKYPIGQSSLNTSEQIPKDQNVYRCKTGLPTGQQFLTNK